MVQTLIHLSKCGATSEDVTSGGNRPLISA